MNENNWISVTDKTLLKHKDKKLLFWNKWALCPEIGWFNNKRELYHGFSHWQTLPKAPKQ